jgi:hypothetical protein
MTPPHLTADTIMDEKLYVLADPADGALIGTDDASGGYPWKPSTFGAVRRFPSREEAEHYSAGKFTVLRALCGLN